MESTAGGGASAGRRAPVVSLDASTIEEAMAQYDAEVRRLLSQRAMLSRILLGTMRELSGLTPDEVAARIEGEPRVDSEPVAPNSAIRGLANDDAVPGEGTARYDILTFVNVPDKEGATRVIVNVEAQRSRSPGYDIVTRGVFYASRLISAQRGTEFERSDYGSIKKVYSIWICMDAPRGVGNAVSSWSFRQENRLGELPDRPKTYDKAEVVVVVLDEGDPSADEPVGLLNLVLSTSIPRDEKIRGLEERYNIPVKGDVEEGVRAMCNLSEYVWERATKEGMEQGMQQGREDLLIDLIVGNLRRGKSYEQIADSLMITVADVKRLEQKALATA